jgi:hypothetical protein
MQQLASSASSPATISDSGEAEDGARTSGYSGPMATDDPGASSAPGIELVMTAATHACEELCVAAAAAVDAWKGPKSRAEFLRAKSAAASSALVAAKAAAAECEKAAAAPAPSATKALYLARRSTLERLVHVYDAASAIGCADKCLSGYSGIVKTLLMGRKVAASGESWTLGPWSEDRVDALQNLFKEHGSMGTKGAYASGRRLGPAVDVWLEIATKKEEELAEMPLPALSDLPYKIVVDCRIVAGLNYKEKLDALGWNGKFPVGHDQHRVMLDRAIGLLEDDSVNINVPPDLPQRLRNAPDAWLEGIWPYQKRFACLFIVVDSGTKEKIECYMKKKTKF